MTSATSTLAIGVDSRSGQANVKGMRTELDKLTRAGENADKQTTLLSRSLAGVGGVIAGIGVANGLTTLTRDLAELQGINSRLTNLTGDLAGQQNFLRETAAAIPI